MKFIVTYTEVVEADTRNDAEKQVAYRISGNGKITSKAMCIHGKVNTNGRCYDMCPFRENGMCDIDFQV